MSPTTTTTLLRILPLLTSTTLLTYAYTEHLFLSPFTHASLHPSSTTFLPPYFRIWLSRGKYVIILGYPLTFLASAANLYTLSSLPPSSSSSSSTVWKLYAAGMLFNLAHIFVFGRRALGLLEDIKAGRGRRSEGGKGKEEGGDGGGVTESMRVWLEMHVFRTVTTDLPAWVCFVAAVCLGW
ncbi:hypothetical protein DM02DRAFT_593419 [Periconia macrospinosa]|uniref:DUF1772-domain-containing protein n=1 Tax=Periconia macrospinosa TaxID=97972 RepID=A0A2V1DPF7_9PLEO|nr:hypothetical protein DM02DRAFT_593419 [Periconia macrospinosa]